MNTDANISNESFYINNAGIVLLHPYVSMLFERLGLTESNTFISEESQLKAPLYLQYLVSGQSDTEEHFLVFNKILCGVDISSPIPNGIVVTSEEESLMNGLLEATIENWRVLGETSIEGFRSSFLMRDGKIDAQENEWNLRVEQKSYDVLIDQLPYSYTPIKLPWMEKMVQVIWR